MNPDLVYEFRLISPQGVQVARYERPDVNSAWHLVSMGFVEKYAPPPPLPDALQRYPDQRLVHPELNPGPPEFGSDAVPDGPGPAADAGGHRGFG